VSRFVMIRREKKRRLRKIFFSVLFHLPLTFLPPISL
jgi:hypothetical protein